MYDAVRQTDPELAAKRRELFEIGKQTELRRIEVIEA